MSSSETALIYWSHHEGDEIAEDDNLSAAEVAAKAFQAGWKLAGGDQRLRTVAKLQEMVAGHCDARAGKQFCEDYGCSTLNDLRRLLGDLDVEPKEGSEQCEATNAGGDRCVRKAGGHTAHHPGNGPVVVVGNLAALAYDHCRLIETELLLRKVNPPEELVEEYRGAVYAVTQLSAMVAEQMEAGA